MKSCVCVIYPCYFVFHFNSYHFIMIYSLLITYCLLMIAIALDWSDITLTVTAEWGVPSVPCHGDVISQECWPDRSGVITAG